jgi:hypothetical protein
MNQSGRNKSAEKRVRNQRFGFELRMELASQKPGVIGDLY